MSKQELETAQALRDIERENKNCKAAVVLAKEWIAEKDAEIGRLKAENEKLRAVLQDVERWLAIFVAAWDKSHDKKGLRLLTKPSEAPVALMEAIRQHSAVRAALETDDD